MAGFSRVSQTTEYAYGAVALTHLSMKRAARVFVLVLTVWALAGCSIDTHSGQESGDAARSALTDYAEVTALFAVVDQAIADGNLNAAERRLDRASSTLRPPVTSKLAFQEDDQSAGADFAGAVLRSLDQLQLSYRARLAMVQQKEPGASHLKEQQKLELDKLDEFIDSSDISQFGVSDAELNRWLDRSGQRSLRAYNRTEKKVRFDTS